MGINSNKVPQHEAGDRPHLGLLCHLKTMHGAHSPPTPTSLISTLQEVLVPWLEGGRGRDLVLFLCKCNAH